MQTQLTLNIDNQAAELANYYAKEKGVSINELFENYIRLIVLNEQLYKLGTAEISSIFLKYKQNFGLKKTNWKELDEHLNPIRHGLPVDFKFDRDIANER